MRITDAQVHVWERVAIPEAAHRVLPLGHEELRNTMEQAGVSRAVLVPPIWAADGNEVALAAARADPDRFAVMGKFDTEQRGGPDRLRSWMTREGMLGIRLALFSRQHRTAVTEGRLEWFWREAESADIPLMVYPPHLLSELDRIASEHPSLRIIIDHCGAPGKRGSETLRAAVTELVKLAGHAHIGVKISNLPFFSGTRYPFPDVQDLMLSVLDAFGPDRVFWGSDLTRLDCTYREAVTMMTEDFPRLQGSVLESVMGGGLCKWLEWRDRPEAERIGGVKRLASGGAHEDATAEPTTPVSAGGEGHA